MLAGPSICWDEPLPTTKFCRAVASRRRCRPHSSCPLAKLAASSPFGRISSSPEMLRISGDPSGLPWTPASQFRYRSTVSRTLAPMLSKILWLAWFVPGQCSQKFILRLVIPTYFPQNLCCQSRPFTVASLRPHLHISHLS